MLTTNQFIASNRNVMFRAESFAFVFREQSPNNLIRNRKIDKFENLADHRVINRIFLSNIFNHMLSLVRKSEPIIVKVTAVNFNELLVFLEEFSPKLVDVIFS